MNAIRRIAHLDMDAFYASVELLRYPQLRGFAVVVGGRSLTAPAPESPPEGFARLRTYAGRGVVTTATYEARQLGVHSGMGIMKAAQLAPDAILLPANFDAYRHYSRLFKQAVARIAATIEDRGIDEIYIDLTDVPGETRELGERIRQAVRDATGLTCSMGISPNKLLSKLCSELDKPNGLTLLSAEEITTRIWPLAVKRINGIGPKAADKLARLGLNTIGELAAADPAMLQTHFGRSYAEWLHAAAHGRDDRPVVTHSKPKSVSRETTFEHDLHPKTDRETLGRIFTDLCVRVSQDLERKGVAGKTVGIKIRFDDFQTVTRDTTLTLPVTDSKTIRKAAGECLKRVELTRKIRLLGVRIGNLCPRTHPHDLTHNTVQTEFDFSG